MADLSFFFVPEMSEECYHLSRTILLRKLHTITYFMLFLKLLMFYKVYTYVSMPLPITYV